MAQTRPHEQLLELSGEPVTLHEVTAGGPDGRYVGASEAACRLLGYAREELLQLTPRDLAAPGQALFGPRDADALLGGGVLTRTAQLRTRDGSIVSVEVRSAAVDDAQGRTLAMSVLRDLAPRREADEAQQRYLALLHLAPDAIVVSGEGHRIVLWNKGAEATYGWTQEEALGRTPRELLKSRDHLPPVRGSVGAMLEEQGYWEGEVTHTCKDGREIRVASRWLVQRDPQGRLVGVLGINRDMTEQLAARERMQRLLRLESVSRLAAGVAHDFNNRLAVILSCAEELRRGLPAAAPHLLELVEEIVAAGTGSKQLTRELVAFAHALPEDSEPFDLNEVVTRCERALRPFLPQGVELVVRLEAPLWRASCDPTSVERAILNLALNARDAMPGGGRLTLASGNVEVDQGLMSAHPFMRRGPYVRLTVADSGSGMTPEVKAHAFEPFFTTKPHGQGVGLGLASAYGMVKQSGGYIILESEPGSGTTFDLYFPRATSAGP
jgi:two-component system cell cycle sensor histidine kinase/response regulator CckA